MSIKSKHLLIPCIMVYACLLAACSESEPDNIGEPYPKADPVFRPYLSSDGNLENVRFTPTQTVTLGETQSSQIQFDSEILIEGADSGFLIALDTDIATVVSTNNDQYTQETTLPEFILYTREQRVFLYDFSSRHHHELIDFANPKDDEPNGTICDLRNVITLDNIAFERMEVILKDELSAYIALSPTGDCSQPTGFFRMDIRESEKAKDIFIVEKTHLVQAATEGIEGAENINSNINDPVFDLELPQWLVDLAVSLKASEDAGENPDIDYKKLTPETDTRRHTLKKYVATLQATNSALVYADTPIIDQSNLRVGYLGLDVLSNQLRFSEHDPATKRNTEIWQLGVAAPEGAAIHPEVNSIDRQSKLLSTENKPYRYYASADFVLIEAGWDIVKLSHDIIFDDERQTERELALSNPFFSREPGLTYTNANLDLDYQTGSIAILDWQDKSIHYAKDGGAPLQVKRLNESNLVQADVTATLSRIFITKWYSDQTKVLTSATLPSRTVPSVETTLLASDPSIQWELGKMGDTVVLNTVNIDSGAIKAFDLTPARSVISDDAAMEDSFFVRVKDSRFFTDSNEHWALLHSGTTARSANDRWYLWNPTLYKYNRDAPEGRGGVLKNFSIDLANAFSNTWTPAIPTLRIISEQAKADDIEKPLQLAPWAYRYRNFAQYSYRNVLDAEWHEIYDPIIDTGFFAAPVEEEDDGTTPVVIGPDKPKVGEED